MTEQKIRFAAIGLNHFHIYGQTEMLLEAGAELVSYYATEPWLIAAYAKEYPLAQLARSAQDRSSVTTQITPVGVRRQQAPTSGRSQMPASQVVLGPRKMPWCSARYWSSAEVPHLGAPRMKKSGRRCMVVTR